MSEYVVKITLDKGHIRWYNTQASTDATEYRGVEQLVARRAHNPEVVGSSPASATIKVPKTIRFSELFFCFGAEMLE